MNQCIPPSPVVTFDPTVFKAAYPQFSLISDAQLTEWFNQAEGLFANNTANPAFPDGRMAYLYNLLVAHVGILQSTVDASGNIIPGGTGRVGFVTNASEGSVSVGLSVGDVTAGGPSEAFYVQTTYGFLFWQATAQYRTMRPVLNPTIVPGAIFPGFGIGPFVQRGCRGCR
jgi:hypothetical protein